MSTSNFRLHQAARLLRNGGILAWPTEAVWGLGCDPLNPQAVYRLLDIKQRSVRKGLILIAAELGQIQPFVDTSNPAIIKAVLASWPGPHTWLLPAAPNTPDWLTGGRRRIAVRITAHPLSRKLCRAFGGALISTSANRSGRPPARSALQVHLRCPGIDSLLHGSTSGLARPTSIRDAISGQWLRN